jgi:2'-5' RNA ligase
MSDQIGAHFTICHDLGDHQLVQIDILRRHPTVRLRIGGVQCWGRPSLGIYLEVEDADGALDSLRDSLGVERESAVPFTPHVTLTHPRTTPVERAQEAWTALSAWRLDRDIEIGSIDVIEHDGTRWRSTHHMLLHESP